MITTPLLLSAEDRRRGIAIAARYGGTTLAQGVRAALAYVAAAMARGDVLSAEQPAGDRTSVQVRLHEDERATAQALAKLLIGVQEIGAGVRLALAIAEPAVQQIHA